MSRPCCGWCVIAIPRGSRACTSTSRRVAAEQLYKRLGWQIIRDDHYDGIAVSVLKKYLCQARP
jgi:hypothetical protein